MSMIRHRPRRQALGLAAAGLCMAALVAPTAAVTCTEEIARLEQAYGLVGERGRESRSERGTGPYGTRLSETKRVQMETLLNAAKAAEQQRRSAECFAHLSEARAIPEPG
jgi:hypothetical protein